MFADGMVLSLDDYRAVKVAGHRSRGWSGRQDKGHKAMIKNLAEALVSGGPWPIPLDQQIAATRISFEVQRLLTI